jgi:hypothetical protein
LFSIRRVLATLVCAGALFSLVSPTADAGTLAPDHQTAVRPIIFPIVGSTSFTDTFGACRSGCSRSHEGIDLMSPKLTKMVSTRDATVSWLKDTATPDGSNGNYVILKDPAGWEYWYIHVNNDSPGTDDGANPPEWMFGPGIVKGAKVRAGQLVGYVGDSGNAESTAPHLHFEIHKPDGTIINPYDSLVQAPRLSAPIDPAKVPAGDTDFVTALARDFLDRAPTDLEWAVAVDRLRAGASGSTVVHAYATSDEWMSVLITSYYRSTLGRDPDAAGLRYWIDRMRAGMSAGDVATYFYAGDEYFTRSGGTVTAWVGDLYREILLRRADQGGLDFWVAQHAAGASRSTIAADFYRSIESRRTRVTNLYLALLGRTPDTEGRDYWAGILTDGHDIRLATELAGSAEYYRRAGQRF